jgi:hypothetical protein
VAFKTSGSDPDPIRLLDPDPYFEETSGTSEDAKNTKDVRNSGHIITKRGVLDFNSRKSYSNSMPENSTSSTGTSGNANYSRTFRTR